MNPLSINPLALLGAGAIAVAIGFGSGWAAQGWRKDAEIADIKADRATEIASATTVALADFKTQANRIAKAATDSQVDFSKFSGQLAAIRKEFHREKPPALPANCKPDPIRVRYLTDAASATDKAATGQPPSAAVQGSRQTGQ